MAAVYNEASLIGFIIGLLFLIICVILWFTLKIPEVYGDLSGRTARKSIEERRRRNEELRASVYKGILRQEIGSEAIQIRRLSYSTELLKSDFCMLTDIVFIHTDEVI